MDPAAFMRIPPVDPGELAVSKLIFPDASLPADVRITISPPPVTPLPETSSILPPVALALEPACAIMFPATLSAVFPAENKRFPLEDTLSPDCKDTEPEIPADAFPEETMTSPVLVAPDSLPIEIAPLVPVSLFPEYILIDPPVRLLEVPACITTLPPIPVVCPAIM